MTSKSQPRCATSDFEPQRLGPRAAALWRELSAESSTVQRRVLIGEACRLTDRLDKLDQLLCGDIDSWSRLVFRSQCEDYELKIDGAAIEARQTATALSRIIAQLGGQQSEGTGGSIADEIAARRAAREATTAG